VKSFDERAEASNRPRGHGGNNPSRKEIHAVQAALASRYRQLHADLASLDVFLRLNGSGDASEGPPQPGSAGHELLIERYEKIAAEIRKVRVAVSNVDFDVGDKEKFRASLKEAALSWDARVKMVRATDSTVIEAALKAIRQHEVKAGSYKKALRPYFGPELEDEGEGEGE
jgi:hypothetical protein